MKKTLLLIFGILSLIQNADSQIDEIVVPQREMNYYYYQVSTTHVNGDGNICLLFYNEALGIQQIDVLDGGNYSLLTSKEISLPGYSDFSVMGVYTDSPNEISFLATAYKSDSLFILNMSFGMDSDELSIIDKAYVEQDNPEIEFASGTRIRAYENGYYTLLNFFGSGIHAEKYALVKIDESGQIHQLGKLDSSEDESVLFSLRYANDMIVLNENQFMVSGVNALGAIVDSHLNVVYESALSNLNNEEGIEHYGIDRGKLLRQSEDQFVVTGFSGRDDAFGTWGVSLNCTIVDDSISQEDFQFLSTKNGRQVSYTYISGENNGDSNAAYYIAQSPLFPGNLASTTPSYFHINKIQGNEEIWSKAYGGDYFYFIHDFTRIANDKLLVVGSVFDYYGTNYLQGFYAFFDGDGNVISSNINLSASTINLDLYPNPTTGMININLGDISISNPNYLLLDEAGKQLMRFDNCETLNISGFETGVYFLQIFDGNQYLVTQKIIKEDR